MDIKVFFSSDWHNGLKTDEIDRTEEIINIGLDFIEEAHTAQEEGYEVYIILGGDLFNENNPSEKVIASFFPILNKLKKYDLKTYYVIGNHESVYDPDRLSCLGFLKKAKVGYPNITVVEDIASIKIGDFDTGPVHFTFLPHITSATLEMNHRKGKAIEIDTVKQYIDAKCTAIVKKLGKGVNHYVFSHLNISGAHPGSEENLLKKSEAYLPSVITNTPLEYTKPTVIQAHIHTQQKIGNIHIIGSPIFCGFGEKGPKYYSVTTISKEIGKKDSVDLFKTKYRPFLQLELNLIGSTQDFFDIPEFMEFWNEVATNQNRNPIVKLDVTINPENNTYDWTGIREKIMRLLDGVHVKPIIPKVVAKKHVRSVAQKLGLQPVDAVKVYITKNLKKDPERAKRIYKRSKKYLGV